MNVRALKKIANIEKTAAQNRPLYFNPEKGRYQLQPARPGTMSYLQFLANEVGEQWRAGNKFLKKPLDWADVSQLKSEGYFPEGPYWTRDMPTEQHGGGFSPVPRMVSLPSREVDGKKQYPRSVVAHELGHVKTMSEKRDGFLGHIPFFRWKSPMDVNKKKYPNYFKLGEDPKFLDTGSSLDSMTNGVDRAKMPDLLKGEVDAWDNAPGKYDSEIRENALDTYRGKLADDWRKYALSKLVGLEMPSLEQGFNPMFVNSALDRSYRMNQPLKQVHYGDDTLEGFVPRKGYDPEKYFPEVREFWRTNSIDKARAHLEELKKHENEYERSRK